MCCHTETEVADQRCQQNRRSTTFSTTAPSGGNRDTTYGRRMSQPPTSCGEWRKTCDAPPNSWQHVDWGSKHSWLTAEEEEISPTVYWLTASHSLHWPYRPGTWHGNHKGTNLSINGMTRPGKGQADPISPGLKANAFLLSHQCFFIEWKHTTGGWPVSGINWYKDLHAALMKEWKEKKRSWKLQSKHLYQFSFSELLSARKIIHEHQDQTHLYRLCRYRFSKLHNIRSCNYHIAVLHSPTDSDIFLTQL